MASDAQAALQPFEARLAANSRWALSEASEFFEGRGAVQETLRRISKRLSELDIPHAVCGGLALFAHGFRRFTEDVDLLVTPEGLRQIHQKLEGLGYVAPFTGSKNLRDAATRVKIEFLVTGQFPGDGKAKPIAFPNPSDVTIEKDGIRYIGLTTLIELKLASGMTEVSRLKDLADVVELVKALDLPEAYAEQLAPFVRSKYLELWRSTRQTPRRFIRIWRNKFLTVDARSLQEMAAALKAAADELEAMQADGVTLDPGGGAGDDYAYLVTSDPDVAKKYDMHDEAEFLGEDLDKLPV
ncbi:MAG TPA: hypothetical protein VGB55_07715, partial [Tepidisphaeraceae bacterium]